MSYASLDAWIDAHFDDEVRFLQQLVQVPTPTPPGDNTPHAERIHSGREHYLAVSAGTLSHRLRSAPPSYNVLQITDDGVTISPFSYIDGRFEALPTQDFVLAPA